MDLLRARVAFRDRAFTDVLDLATRFLVTHARVYARVAAVVLAPALLLTWAAARLASWEAAWVVAVGFAFAGQVPFTVLASRLVFQERVRARDVLREAARDLPRVLVMRAVWLAGVVLGALVFLVPGGWLATALLFATEVMLLERAGVGTAFARAHRLATNGFADAVLGVAMIVLAPATGIVLGDVAGRILLTELFQLPVPPGLLEAHGSVLALAGFFLVVPWVATARFFLYLNGRTRAEGWDIQTRFAALAARYEREEAARIDGGSRAA